MTIENDKGSLIEKLDVDEKLTSKGKVLTTVSLILIALEVTGAVMKEANTFLFKIEFANQGGISHLLIAAVVYLVVRYRNYAQPYHHELFLLWSNRMMQDRAVFNYSNSEEIVKGFLGDAFDLFGGDEPGIKDSKYTVTGFLRRGITYPTVWRGENPNGDYIESSDYDYFSLYTFTDKWTIRKYICLLIIEFKYRINSFINYREHLDVLSPYMFAFLAIVSSAVPWGTFT
ncbi:hypothetical protein [Vibrio metschnikovii]|uniref:hypothetical protein n=1 Tax=Vibrio metschnikovii TaxID=28172 RepID=UPI002FC59ADD